MLFSFYYIHEEAHVAIYNSYEIEAKIEPFKYFPNMMTEAESPCPKDTYCELAHNINEIVTYPMQFILLFLMIISCFQLYKIIYCQ